MLLWIALSLTLIEVLLLGAGGTLLFFRAGYRAAAALALGVVGALLSLSLLFQVAFLLGQPSLSLLGEAGLLVLCVRLLWRERKPARAWLARAVAFVRLNPRWSSFFGLSWGYLAALAFLLPPSNWDSMTYNLARIQLFRQAESLFLTQITTYRQAVFPLGSDILAQLWLRLGSDYGLGLFSFLAYVAIVVGVYALAREMVAVPPALTAALVVAGLPELVYQATSTKNDIIAAAVAIACFLSAKHLLRQHATDDLPSAFDVLTMGLFLAFGVAVKLNFVFFGLPFVSGLGLVLWRRWGLTGGRRWVARHWRQALLALPAMAVLSQAWLFLYNRLAWGGWSGLPEFTALHRHSDGLVGMIANLGRYLFESAHFLAPVDWLFQRLTGYWLSGILQRLHEETLGRLFGAAGSPAHSFAIRWLPHEDFSWFGPLGFALLLPALVYGLWRGSAWMRVIVLSLLGYVGVLAALVAWMPWNNRFFSMFFAGAGVCLAFWLARWPSRVLPLLQITAAAILLYALSFNHLKPLGWQVWPAATWAYRLEPVNIWEAGRSGGDRFYYAAQHFGDRRVETVLTDLPPGAQVGLWVSDESWIYPFYLRRPDLHFVPLNYAPVGAPPQTLADKLITLDYLLCLDRDCMAETADLGLTVRWQAADRPGVRAGVLFAVPPLPR